MTQFEKLFSLGFRVAELVYSSEPERALSTSVSHHGKAAALHFDVVLCADSCTCGHWDTFS